MCGRTVALLLAVPEVTSLSELAGKNIAIDDAKASASNDEARRKLEATVMMQNWPKVVRRR